MYRIILSNFKTSTTEGEYQIKIQWTQVSFSRHVHLIQVNKLWWTWEELLPLRWSDEQLQRSHEQYLMRVQLRVSEQPPNDSGQALRCRSPTNIFKERPHSLLQIFKPRFRNKGPGLIWQHHYLPKRISTIQNPALASFHVNRLYLKATRLQFCGKASSKQIMIFTRSPHVWLWIWELPHVLLRGLGPLDIASIPSRTDFDQSKPRRGLTLRLE